MQSAPVHSRLTNYLEEKRYKKTVSLSDEKDNMEKAVKNSAAQRLATLRPRLFEMGVNHVDIGHIELRRPKKQMVSVWD